MTLRIRQSILAFATATALLAALSANAVAQSAGPGPLMFQGHQFMSAEEMVEMMEKMRGATSDDECDKIRAEHHEGMKMRAAEMGIELPEEPNWENMPRRCGPNMMMGGNGMMQGQSDDD